MKHVGVEVDTVRPADSASNRIDCHRRKDHVIVNRREHAEQRAGEVEVPNETIGKRHAQHSTTKMFDVGHSGECAHTFTLLQRLDTRKGGGNLSERPICLQLTLMQSSPLLDEALGSDREVPSDR